MVSELIWILPYAKVFSSIFNLSSRPSNLFVFRNYEYSGEDVINRMGSSSNAVWEAVRASSAAIYYLDTFECRGNKFQDGALVANNPSLIALQEAGQTKIQSFVEISTVPRLSRKLRVRSEPSNFLSNSGIDVSVVRQKILLQVVPHAVSDSE